MLGTGHLEVFFPSDLGIREVLGGMQTSAVIGSAIILQKALSL